MADDPNRDLLPVKDGCRQICGPQKLKPTNSMSIPSYSTFGEDSKDLQQRHYVTKLDRDDLEDRFLRMMEDQTQMKKRCNSQEEKIKRLATKLLRIVSDRDRALKSASDRRDHHAMDRLDEMQDRVNDLENCNQQLQERIVVLKTQLGTHSKLHASIHYNVASQSPSRSGNRSRPCSRTASGSDQETMIKRDSWDQQGESKGSSVEENLRIKVKHLEQELASMQEQYRTKMMQLEQQISYLSAEEQRNRAAENIEMIRLKREMKTQSMQMEAVKAKSFESELELEKVRCELKDCQSNNCQLSQELNVVKTSNQDLQEQLKDAKGKLEYSRELINQMSDLQLEHQALESQNSQLLDIASKTIYSDSCDVVVEQDNQDYNGACSEDCLGGQGYPQGSNSRSSGQMQKTGSCDEDCLGDQGYPQGSNSRSSGQIEKTGSCDEDSQDMYDEVERVNDPGNSSPSVQSDIDENEVPEIGGKDSHWRAHNRLCTCDKDSRKRFFPSCNCGCTLCDNAQLSKNGSATGQRARQSQMSDHLSEHYVRQQDLASWSNQYSSRDGILTGVSASQSRKLQFSGSPIGKRSNEAELIGRMTGPTKSAEPKCNLQCRESSKNRMEIQVNPGSNKPLGSECHMECADQPCSRVDVRKNAGSPTFSGRQEAPVRSSSSSGPNKGSNKPLGSECHMECADQPCSGVDVRKNAGSPTFSGRLEMPACSSTCSGPKEGSNKPLGTERHKERADQPRSGVDVRKNAGSPTFNERQEPPAWSNSSSGPNKGSSQNWREKKVPSGTYNQLNAPPDKGCRASTSTGCAPVDSMASKANEADILHELEVCKELLRVQCSLNSSFKNELTKLYAEISKLEGSTSGSSGTVSSGSSNETKPGNISDVTPSQDGMGRKSLLRIGDGEGLFEIHAHCIELSDEGSIHIPPNRGMFLTWTFYNQAVAYTPVKKGPKADINTSAVYRVHVTDDFLEHLHTEACYIDLHASKDDSSELIARGVLKFSEILDFPQNKLHSSVRLLSVKPCEECSHTLGMLQCWFRLSCDLSIINKFNEGRIPSPKSYESPLGSGTDGFKVKPHQEAVMQSFKVIR